MYKPTKNVYTIRTSPYNDNEQLENLLNEMSKDGWDLYSMQEIENNDGVFYNCIFVKEVESDDSSLDDRRAVIEEELLELADMIALGADEKSSIQTLLDLAECVR